MRPLADNARLRAHQSPEPPGTWDACRSFALALGIDLADDRSEMSTTDRYWCRFWYPADAADRPCAVFFVAGTYVGHVDPAGDPVEMLWEGDPDVVQCTVHDSAPDTIETAVWEARLASAHRLAAARQYLIPRPVAWGDPSAIGPITGPAPGDCDSWSRPGSYGSRCEGPCVYVAIERGGVTHEKVICQQVLRDVERGYVRDLSRTMHANECLPYLPPNF